MGPSDIPSCLDVNQLGGGSCAVRFGRVYSRIYRYAFRQHVTTSHPLLLGHLSLGATTGSSVEPFVPFVEIDEFVFEPVEPVLGDDFVDRSGDSFRVPVGPPLVVVQQ